MLQERLFQGTVSSNMVAHLLPTTKKSGLVIVSMIAGGMVAGGNSHTLWLDIHRPTLILADGHHVYLHPSGLFGSSSKCTAHCRVDQERGHF